MPKVPDIKIDLDKLNHSELVLLSNWSGMKVTRAVPRNLIIESLKNFEPLNLPDPIDTARSRISRWLNKHWDRVQMQAQKKVCPKCHLCRDLQVVECYSANKKYFES